TRERTMCGVRGQEPLGRTLVGEVQVVTGYSFNSADTAGSSTHKARVKVPLAVIAVDDSFAWEIRFALWRELGPRLGFMAAVRYLNTRPQFTFADGRQRLWKADRVTLEAGLAVTLIKPPRDR